MTPAYDWTRFDAIRDALAAQTVTPWGARLGGKVADAREALERGQPVRMRQADRHVTAHTPAHFVDAWEAGYRP